MNTVSLPRTSPVLSKAVTYPMPQFAVSIRHVFDEWPVEDFPQIDAARRQYDEGTVEVCTGRAGEYFVLYCIPRKKKAKDHRFYFCNQDL